MFREDDSLEVVVVQHDADLPGRRGHPRPRGHRERAGAQGPQQVRRGPEREHVVPTACEDLGPSASGEDNNLGILLPSQTSMEVPEDGVRHTLVDPEDDPGRGSRTAQR